MSIIHKNITLRGQVQGVFLRATTQRMGRKLGVNGFVKNKSDGSVYAEAEGKLDAVSSFIDWCHQGSPGAKVKEVEVSDGPVQDYTDFRIVR